MAPRIRRVIVVQIDKELIGPFYPHGRGPTSVRPIACGPYATPDASALPTAGAPNCLRFLKRHHKYFVPVLRIATALRWIASATSFNRLISLE